MAIMLRTRAKQFLVATAVFVALVLAVDKTVVGAIGVSGEASADDEQCARVGMQAGLK
jgi:uncharacterized protein GlcG (DUF336 family)